MARCFASQQGIIPTGNAAAFVPDLQTCMVFFFYMSRTNIFTEGVLSKCKEIKLKYEAKHVCKKNSDLLACSFHIS